MAIQDDAPKVILRRDLSGGINTRQAGYQIAENQVTNFQNAEIGVVGEISKRKGIDLLKDIGDADVGVGAFGFMPDGGTNELLLIHGQKLEGITNFTTGANTTHDNGFTTGLLTKIVQVWKSGGDGSVVLISNGTDNVHEMKQDHSVTDLGNGASDPPLTTVMEFYRGRLWSLLDNSLYFSDAYPNDYAGTRDVLSFQINCGAERFLLGLRDTGLIVGGKDSIWGINPSAVPVAADKPEKILDLGCAAGNTACNVADDILFLAYDGVRGLFRTVNDKMQAGESYPLSYNLKDEFDSINWAQISKACAVYFDNKYMIALPVDSSSTNNEVWVFYPATKSWTVFTGWNVGAWAKIKVAGQERLYYIDATEDKVYRCFSGYDDNGTAVSYTEEGRKEDMGAPLQKKYGGELKIKALSSGNYNLTVSASIDDEDYTSLGTMNLTGQAPTLPVLLPFTLAPADILEEQFHLDPLGEWYTIRIKIENAEANTDDIKIYERKIVAFANPYMSEE